MYGQAKYDDEKSIENVKQVIRLSKLLTFTFKTNVLYYIGVGSNWKIYCSYETGLN